MTEIALPTSSEATYSIGDTAFAYTGLKEISIPKAVGWLGSGVFNRSSDLAKVVFEAGANPKCGTSLFAYTAVSGVTLPEGVEAISDYMFQGCVNRPP